MFYMFVMTPVLFAISEHYNEIKSGNQTYVTITTVSTKSL